MVKTGLPAFSLMLALVVGLVFLYASASQTQAQLAADRDSMTRFSSTLTIWGDLMAEAGPHEPSEVFEPAARRALQAILASPSLVAMGKTGLVSKSALERLAVDAATPAYFTRIPRDFAQVEANYRTFLDQQRRTFGFLEIGMYLAISGLAALLVFWLLEERRRQDRYRELQLIYRQSLVTLEEERLRIALDLHDTVAQELVALKFQLARFGAEEPAKAAMQVTLERAQSTLRNIARGLRPPAIDQVGLVGVLGDLCQEFSRTTGVRVTRELESGAPLGLAPESEIHIYRIVQECLNNAWKHADCGEILVSTWIEEGLFKVRIRDDGVGISPNPSASQGMGLTGMRERTALLGAQFTVESSPGHGTTVLLEVPL